jgi:hypothetical protein
MGGDLLYTSITRFGTLAFLIFVVVVLLRVYQYLMRLAAYYDSRADALELMLQGNKEQAELLSQFSLVLTADKIDFGPQISTPMEAVAEIFKAAKKDA